MTIYQRMVLDYLNGVSMWLAGGYVRPADIRRDARLAELVYRVIGG